MDTPVEQYFINEQSDFFNYMVDMQLFKNRQTYHDYMTRLRYVSQFFRLDKSLTKGDVEAIVAELKRTMSERNRYNSMRSVGDIASGLHRFLEYVESDYRKKLDESIISEEKKIDKNVVLSETEKEAIIRARVGQGIFRQKLIDYWRGCSVTQCRMYPILLASHIQPWRKSNNDQRLDVFNGFLLTPNLDKLFDKGYISFDEKGKVICSDLFPCSDRKILGVDSSLRLVHVEERHLPYLQYHRENCFM
ncbi:MAG: HNH endonuclease [Bacteroidaceae bacterium]|nr:HNH endonuclease [Bacteroidaceae bacterium]